MSTFDGIVEEFPDIRIDYFRHHTSRTPPAACFLSHVHSDHLLGLETLRMPFVYCSAATRKLLLQMEKYPHRLNFSKGILESRKQTYKHLKFILRALPLQTSVELELTPKCHIKVTLFDANHCPGAVMFLIEGDNRAILYTGDIRAESWWVNSLVRNPVLIPFATGLKHLDCLYLDTTFASHQDIYREFPSKAQGLAELTQKVRSCAEDSIFYFRAWTLGYEDVWITLRNLLDSQVHVDRYQLQLFGNIARDGIDVDCGPALMGFPVGNKFHPGCLTQDSNVRVHSCEPGMACHRALSKRDDVIWITPIISRSKDGTEVAEIGAGGGGGDLFQRMEVDFGNQTLLEGLRLLRSSITDDTEVIKRAEAALNKIRGQQDSQLALDGLGLDPSEDVSIEEFITMLLQNDSLSSPKLPRVVEPQAKTTKIVHFPYSRHSSYSELRELVRALRPQDICPCTVSLENWSEELSMNSLFGDLCSSSRFRYDEVIRQEVLLRGESVTTATQGRQSQLPVSTQDVIVEGSQTHSSSQGTEDFQEAVATATIALDTETMLTKSPSITDRRALLRPDETTNTEQVHVAWRMTNNSADTYQMSVGKATQTWPETSSLEISESSSEFSKPLLQPGQHDHTKFDNRSTPRAIRRPSTDDSYPDEGYQAGSNKRRKAFQAAKACLDGNQEDWTGLHLRSLGWKGHTEEELEL